MTILAIDVGEKRVGVAATDSLEITVQPLEVFAADTAVKDIMVLCKDRNPETIIIGMPYNAEGEEGFAAKKIKKFRVEFERELLKESLTAEIIYWDEAFTTEKATKWLQKAGVKGRKQREVIDKLAAAAILEDYLSAR